MKIALILPINKNKDTAMNKDLNGGFGTCDEYGDSVSSRIIKFIKQRSVRLPVISFAFLQAIFKQQGHEVDYFEESLPSKGEYDLILIYGTVVDYKNEKATTELLKDRFPKAKVGIFGPFPATKPELFEGVGDFILTGEPESFFMNDFKDLSQLKGRVPSSSETNMDLLPSPDFDNFPIKKYSYSPAITKKPFLVLQASKGCPYSCKYYCVYGDYQGPRIRQRSAKKVVDDIVHLQHKYKIKGIQFRDPVFGLNRTWVKEFCEELKNRNVKIEWGMETRLDLLNEENIKMMHEVGLRNVNVGIETSDPEIADKNKRKLVASNHQESIIDYCKRIGVGISTFFILGYDGDTLETMRKTVNYAIKLNTPLARFSVATPYPGTGYYDQLEKENKLLTKDFEQYNQFNLVHKHENLTPQQVKKELESALRKYYFRPSYFFSLTKHLIKNKFLN